jgi:hypothetical protein
MLALYNHGQRMQKRYILGGGIARPLIIFSDGILLDRSPPHDPKKA